MKQNLIIRVTVFTILVMVLTVGETGKFLTPHAATPEPTLAIALSHIYSIHNRNITFAYPSDWIANEDMPGFIAIGSSQAAIDSIPQGRWLKSGQLMIILQAFLPGSSDAAKLDLREGGKSILKSFVESNNNPGFTFGDITDDTVGSIPAGRVEVHSQAVDEIGLAFVQGNTPIIMVLEARTGELAGNEAILKAIAQSIKSTTSPSVHSSNGLNQKFVVNGGRISLNYPDNWIVNEDPRGPITMGNSQAAIAAATNSPIHLTSGQVIFKILPSFGGIEKIGKDTSFSLESLVSAFSSKTVNIGPITYSELGGKPAQRVDLHDTGSDGLGVVFLPHEDTMVTAEMLTAPGEGSTYKAIFEAVALSMKTDVVPPIVVNQTYVTKDKKYSMGYPNGWVVIEDQPGVIAMGTSQSAIDAAESATDPIVDPAELVIFVHIYPRSAPLDLSKGGMSMLKMFAQFGFLTVEPIFPDTVGSLPAGEREIYYRGSDCKVIAFVLGKTPVLVSLLAQSGHLPISRPVLNTIAETITPLNVSVPTQAR